MKRVAKDPDVVSRCQRQIFILVDESQPLRTETLDSTESHDTDTVGLVEGSQITFYNPVSSIEAVE